MAPIAMNRPLRRLQSPHADPLSLREAMRRLTGSVAVITAGIGYERTGLAPTSALALSMEPSTMLITVNRASSSFPVIDRRRHLGVNAPRRRRLGHHGLRRARPRRRAFSSADPTKVWIVSELADWVGIGGLGPLFVGGPQTVADLLEEWIADTGVDGFDLASAVTPETFEDIAAHLMPELQRRGVYQRDYSPGTLREKLFGAGPRLAARHPGARWRDLEAVAPPQFSAAE